MTIQSFVNKLLSEQDPRNVKGWLKLCGPQIGGGSHRDVYELKSHKGVVVKFERRDPGTAPNGLFANVTEWRNFIKFWGFKTPIPLG